MANSIGIQDAARKRRFGSQRPGAWAGSIVETSKEGVFVTVSQEKWDKCKRYIRDIVEELNRTQQLNHKELERMRVFLIRDTDLPSHGTISQRYPSNTGNVEAQQR